MMKALEVFSSTDVGSLPAERTEVPGDLARQVLEAEEFQKKLEIFAQARSRDGSTASSSSRAPWDRSLQMLGDSSPQHSREVEEAKNGVLALKQTWQDKSERFKPLVALEVEREIIPLSEDATSEEQEMHIICSGLLQMTIGGCSIRTGTSSRLDEMVAGYVAGFETDDEALAFKQAARALKWHDLMSKISQERQAKEISAERRRLFRVPPES